MRLAYVLKVETESDYVLKGVIDVRFLAIGVLLLSITIATWGQESHYSDPVTQHLPKQTSIMAVVKSPLQAIESLGLTDYLATKVDTFDMTDVDAWNSLGIDPRAPIGVSLVREKNTPVLIVSFGTIGTVEA